MDFNLSRIIEMFEERFGRKGTTVFLVVISLAVGSWALHTLFAFHKMPLRNYLAAIAIFCNEVKGKSALALSRDLDVQYKTAFVLAHKIREAMASEMKGRMVGGVGRVVETDGAYFGGYVKPANQRENRRDRRLTGNQSGKRRVVVVVREREGRTLPSVFRSVMGLAMTAPVSVDWCGYWQRGGSPGA